MKLKIVVNNHIRGLIQKLRNKIQLQNIELIHTKQQLQLQEVQIEQLKSIQQKYNRMLQIGCEYDPHADCLEMRYRINKTALQTCREPRILFEYGWEQMTKEILKLR